MKKFYLCLAVITICAVCQSAPKTKANDKETTGRALVQDLRRSLVGKDAATTDTVTKYRDAMAAWKADLEPRSEAVQKEQVEYNRALRDLQFFMEEGRQ